MPATASSPSLTPKELTDITGAVRYRFKLDTFANACDLCGKPADICWSAYVVYPLGQEDQENGFPAICPHCVIRYGRDAAVMAAQAVVALLGPDDGVVREAYEATLAQLEAGLFDLPLVLTEEMVAP